MAQLLIITMMVSALSFRFLESYGFPGLLKFIPELTAMGAIAIFLLIGVGNRFRYVRPVYWLVFGALSVDLVCGALTNMIESGPLFAGIRTYLRALPFFLLPAVVLLKDRQLRTQLLLLLGFCIVQLPIAWSQRMETQAAGRTTGDQTVGTLVQSGPLSVFLICATCMLTAFYLRGRISRGWYLILLVVFLAPTMINETKITLFMLPVALMTTFYVGAAPGRRLKNTLLGLIVLSGFMAVFIPVYDYFVEPRWGYGIIEFLTMEDRVENYLYKGTGIGVAPEKSTGRVDSILVAVSELSKDPTRLVFGFGIGNASDSALGNQFTGAYYNLFKNFTITALTALFLELGLLGLGLVLLLHWLIFRDSVAVARSDDGMVGTLAAGWAGVSAAIVMGMLYSSALESATLSYLYWYFSGTIAAFRMRSLFGDRPGMTLSSGA